MRKTYNKWTQQELDYLKKNYGKVLISELINNLNHSKIAIYHTAVEKLKLHSIIGYHRYTKQEITYLKKNYGKITAQEIAVKFGRSNAEIRRKAIKLNLKSNLKGFKNKVHTDKTKGIMSIKRKRWYKENPEKAILKAKKVSISQKGNTWEKVYGIEKANIKKEEWKKRFSLERFNPTMNKGHSDKTKKLQSIKENKRYKENPEIKKKISKSVKKLWQNSDYSKNQFKVLQLKPTLPEKQVMQIIKLNKLPFNYTGDGKVILKGLCPDFLSKNSKYIIEVNGEPWHKDKNRELRKKRIYNSLGYKLRVIWTKKLKNPQKVTEKIIDFISK